MKTKRSVIDLHSHILPGLDDGAATWEESVKMAHFAQDAGTKRLFATPHYQKGLFEQTPKRIRELTLELSLRLKELGLDLEVLPGEEVRLTADLPSLYSQGALQTLGDSEFILVELPFDMFPKYTFEVIFQLGLMGVQVIVAHPERNLKISEDISLASRLVDSGAYLQVNAGSLVGAYGKHQEAAAIAMCKKDLVHFIGSDAHSGKNPSLLDRGVDMRQALPAISRHSPKGENLLDEIGKRSLDLINHAL